MFFFSLVLHLARGVTGSIRRYLDPAEVAQVTPPGWHINILPLPEGLLFASAQSEEHEGDSRRPTVTLGELDTTPEGP